MTALVGFAVGYLAVVALVNGAVIAWARRTPRHRP